MLLTEGCARWVEMSKVKNVTLDHRPASHAKFGLQNGDPEWRIYFFQFAPHIYDTFVQFMSSTKILKSLQSAYFMSI